MLGVPIKIYPRIGFVKVILWLKLRKADREKNSILFAGGTVPESSLKDKPFLNLFFLCLATKIAKDYVGH